MSQSSHVKELNSIPEAFVLLLCERIPNLYPEVFGKNIRKK